MGTTNSTTQGANGPNLLVLCMDQWDTHMTFPEDLQFRRWSASKRRG